MFTILNWKTSKVLLKKYMKLCSNTIQQKNDVIKSLKSKTKRLSVQINSKENLILNLRKTNLISRSAEDVLTVRYSLLQLI